MTTIVERFPHRIKRAAVENCCSASGGSRSIATKRYHYCPWDNCAIMVLKTVNGCHPWRFYIIKTCTLSCMITLAMSVASPVLGETTTGKRTPAFGRFASASPPTRRGSSYSPFPAPAGTTPGFRGSAHNSLPTARVSISTPWTSD